MESLTLRQSASSGLCLYVLIRFDALCWILVLHFIKWGDMWETEKEQSHWRCRYFVSDIGQAQREPTSPMMATSNQWAQHREEKTFFKKLFFWPFSTFLHTVCSFATIFDLDQSDVHRSRCRNIITCSIMCGNFQTCLLIIYRKYLHIFTFWNTFKCSNV